MSPGPRASRISSAATKEAAASTSPLVQYSAPAGSLSDAWAAQVPVSRAYQEAGLAILASRLWSSPGVQLCEEDARYAESGPQAPANTISSGTLHCASEKASVVSQAGRQRVLPSEASANEHSSLRW